MKKDFKEEPIDKRSQAVFKQLLPLLYDAVFVDDGDFLLPDEKYILHAAKDLAYNDAPWLHWMTRILSFIASCPESFQRGLV